MAQILEILDRNDEIFPSKLAHFKLKDGDEVQPQLVIDSDTITPYCIDIESERMIFADLPADIDLTTVPFVYATQKEHAKRLIAVSFDELADLTKTMTLPENIILIHSTGRSGSTLLSQIMSNVDGVISYSEPDIFLNLVPMSNLAENRTDIVDLTEQCYKIFTHRHIDETVAIKFRSQCLHIADIFHHVMSQAKNIFLYRNTLKWAASVRRLALEFDAPEQLPLEFAIAFRKDFTGVAPEFTGYIDEGQKTIDLTEFAMMGWLEHMDAFYTMHERGVPFFTMRYEELNTHREAMLSKVFDYVSLPQDQLKSAMKGFETDSQAGTMLARTNNEGNKKQLDDDKVEMVEDMLAAHPRNLTPDTILPGTVFP